MNAIEKFREAVRRAWDDAIAAGVEKDKLNAVLLAIVGIDPEAAREASAALDGLIDGENDELAE